MYSPHSFAVLHLLPHEHQVICYPGLCCRCSPSWAPCTTQYITRCTTITTAITQFSLTGCLARCSPPKRTKAAFPELPKPGGQGTEGTHFPSARVADESPEGDPRPLLGTLQGAPFRQHYQGLGGGASADGPDGISCAPWQLAQQALTMCRPNLVGGSNAYTAVRDT